METTTHTTRPDFSALKNSIHRKVIELVDLDRLNQADQEAARSELAHIIENLLVAESTPMTLQERERLSQEVLDEIFVLGPLEPLL